VTRYIADLRTPVYDERQAAVIDWALRAAAERVWAVGRVTYHHGEYLPTERRFLAWFNAENESLIRRVTDTAQLVGVLVSEVIALGEGPDGADGFDRST
jgi:hypothetical protein